MKTAQERRLWRASGLTGLFLIGSQALAQGVPMGDSRFDAGPDGWVLPPDVQWRADGGNPGGYLRFEDVGRLEAGVITAPAEFLGDWSSLSGRGVLSYDFAVFFESRGDRPGGSITIAGPGGRAHWEAPRPTGGADWRTRLVPIDEANWVVLEGAWAELLRDVRELRISLPVSSRPVSITGIDNIRVGTPCRTDLDGDGELTIFDFLAFQNAFDAGDPIADFDGDGEFTIFDFLGFQNEFDSGCP